MFPLRVGYFVSGIITGFFLLISFLSSLPDGKLHIVICDVGQGDASYIRFPDGRDMLVDGGPNDSVLRCLGNQMPFWDRSIDIVVLSHPEKDHMQGLVSVMDRYRIGYFVRSDVEKDTEIDRKLFARAKEKNIPEKLVTSGEHIQIGTVKLEVLWPTIAQIASMQSGNVLGAATSVNEDCVVFWLRYGSFDALFPGDADSEIEPHFTEGTLADGSVEVLKVPHHGSKTGMTSAFLDWLKPQLAVISVGNNSYGHPSQEALRMLRDIGSKVLRTDQEGDIEIVSDGKTWDIRH